MPLKVNVHGRRHAGIFRKLQGIQPPNYPPSPAQTTNLPRFLVLSPDGSRKLVVRSGFFSPSLDGGLPLLELSNPSRRSSSATRASKLLMISSLAAISASSRAITSVGLTGAAGASSLCVTPAVSKVQSHRYRNSCRQL